MEDRLGGAHDFPMADMSKPSCVGKAWARKVHVGEGTSCPELEVVVIPNPPVDADVLQVPSS